MTIQFKIDNLFEDNSFNIDKICKENDIKLNTSLQKYKNIQLKELFKTIDLESLPDDYYSYTTVRESSLDKLSMRLYNNSQYWWLILLVNKIDNPIKFNMSSRMITILANYLFRYEGKYTEDVYFDLLNEYNDDKKEIRYIKKSYLNEFFRKVLG